MTDMWLFMYCCASNSPRYPESRAGGQSQDRLTMPRARASGNIGLPAGPLTCNSHLTPNGRRGEVASNIQGNSKFRSRTVYETASWPASRHSATRKTVTHTQRVDNIPYQVGLQTRASHNARTVTRGEPFGPNFPFWAEANGIITESCSSTQLLSHFTTKNRT